MENVIGHLRGVEQKVEVDVPHIRQKYRWDCGLASAQMILKYFDVAMDDFQNVCKTMAFGHSVWTIDLANIMNHYKINHLFTTITLGVDMGYSDKSFYKREIQSDEERVNKLFENSNELGIQTMRKSVGLEEIIEHLSKGNVLIALIDWSKLNCKWCNKKCLMTPSLGCLQTCPSIYQGHFVVICGYSLKDKLIYYHNPSYKEELCCCSIKTFEIARKSYGTDEDLVFLFKEKVKNNSHLIKEKLSSN